MGTGGVGDERPWRGGWPGELQPDRAALVLQVVFKFGLKVHV